MSYFTVVTLSVVFVLCQMQVHGHFVMKKKSDDQLNYVNIDDGLDSVSKPSDWENRSNVLSDWFTTNIINKILGDIFSRQHFFISSPLEEFSHSLLIPSNIKKEINLSNRIRRNPQNSTTNKMDSSNNTAHYNISSSTTTVVLPLNKKSKTREKNDTSVKDDNNMSSVASSFIGITAASVANLTIKLTNNSSSGMVGFNSSAGKDEERIEYNRDVDAWIIGSLLFFVFFILAAAAAYRSNIGSQTTSGRIGVRSMFANNNTESIV